mgnify:FL=1
MRLNRIAGREDVLQRGVLAFTVIAAILAVSAVRADDWPQWMGPDRDGRWHESGIIKKFPKEGLNVLWRSPVAGGYSGPAVAAGRVYVADFRVGKGTPTNDPGTRAELEGQERLICLDAESGREMWTYAHDCTYALSYPAGPRATPTVDDGKVYFLGAEGHLACVDAATGKPDWTRELKPDFGIQSPIWGFSGHPLVEGALLYCLVGGDGSVAVAFDKKSGAERWRALSASEPGYAPPTMIELGGKRQLLVWDADALNSLDPQTGKVNWSQPLKPDYGMSIMAPRLSGNLLFASGIGQVGAVFELSTAPLSAEKVWQGNIKNALYAANSTPIIEDGVIDGVDCRPGALRAVELKSGDRLWESYGPTTGGRRAAHGTAFLVRHDRGDYFLFSETGDLVHARLTPDRYEELGRFHVLEPTNEAFGRSVVWSHPAFAERSVFARNDKEIVRVSLAEK